MTHNFLFRLSAIVTFVFATAAFADNTDVEAALRDRAANFPAKDHGYIYYVSTFPLAGDNAKDAAKAVKYIIAATTTQTVLERALPVQVATGLYRIDLRDLNWLYPDWVTVARDRNPYSFGKVPLIVRADWLLVELSDQRDSDSANRLMFHGDRIPKTKDDVFKLFGISNDPQLQFGTIEGDSGVSKQHVRLATSFPVLRGYAWVTSDVLKLDTKHDPLEHLDRNFPFDGQEGIIWHQMISASSGQRVVVPFYWLNDGNGKLIAKANVDLVEDTTNFRNFREIATSGSCIQCHVLGANPFTKDEFHDLQHSGVKVFADQRQAQDIQAFYISKRDKELDRINDDFQSMVTLSTGSSSKEFVKAFTATINRYDAPLYLADVASELAVDAKEFASVLATNVDIPARLASLPMGDKTDKADTRGKIPRAAWEENFAQVYYAAHGGPAIKREADKPAPEQKPAVKSVPQKGR